MWNHLKIFGWLNFELNLNCFARLEKKKWYSQKRMWDSPLPNKLHTSNHWEIENFIYAMNAVHKSVLDTGTPFKWVNS